ncbi:MAG: hypothetical protein QXH97_04925 [Candidatus Bathyarchaeia archaeon]
MTTERKIKFSILIPEPTWEKLSILAIKKRISKNQLILQLIQEALEKENLA